MTVYVDDMRRPARVGSINGVWCHLMADTHLELEAFARRVGLAPSWIQRQGKWTEHYDVTESVRAKCVAAGAVEITYPRGVAELVERKQMADGTLPADYESGWTS
jgi:hypothetical protein